MARSPWFEYTDTYIRIRISEQALADVARAGASTKVESLIEELSRVSPEFERLWRENDVRAHGGGTKQLRHPQPGVIALDYSAFAVDDQPELRMVIYNPATPWMRRRCGP
jgi:hypothetical protein